MKNPALKHLRSAQHVRGFTLVELMVTVAIALFLIGGLLTIIQNVRNRYTDQQALAQLQDQQRFAMSVITDIVQQAGYFPDPVIDTPDTALQAVGPYQSGQAFFGTHVAGNPDHAERPLPHQPDQRHRGRRILCDGSTNWRGPDCHLHQYLHRRASGRQCPRAAAVLGERRCGAHHRQRHPGPAGPVRRQAHRDE